MQITIKCLFISGIRSAGMVLQGYRDVVDVQVVALGAWCDNVTEDGLQFRVEEFATLSDGRRLTLSADRGWSGSRSGRLPGHDPWTDLSVEAIEHFRC